MNIDSEKYLTYVLIHKRKGKTCNLHLIIDIAEETLEVKKVTGGSQMMEHKFYEISDVAPELLTLLKRELFEYAFANRIEIDNPEYEFVYYDEEGHKKVVCCNMDETGPVQELLKWIKSEYGSLELMDEFFKE